MIGCALHPSCDISGIFLTVSGMSGVLDFTENSLAWAVMYYMDVVGECIAAHVKLASLTVLLLGGSIHW